MTSFSEKTVVVTGASAGLGRAITQAFARRGANLALLARGDEGLQGARREAEVLGAAAVLTIPLDISDAGAVDDAAARAEAQLGPIDVWVNDAMVSVFAKVADIRAEEFRRVTEVNYLGFVNGTLAALRHMLPRDAGTIVQVGSALAHRAIPLQGAYCASKHAIAGFSQSLRTELLHDRSNVAVTVVDMPAMNSPQFTWVRSRLPHKPQPVPPIFQPEVGAEAVVWAAEHRPRRMSVGASTVATIMANRLAPGLVDRYLARNGFSSQQTDEPEDADRPDNLDRPLDADDDRGAHGPFDARAKTSSAQVWARQRAGTLLAAGTAALAVLAGAAVKRS